MSSILSGVLWLLGFCVSEVFSFFWVCVWVGGFLVEKCFFEGVFGVFVCLCNSFDNITGALELSNELTCKTDHSRLV